jgi:crossover junction endodeoxyribonuclease RuvC
MVCAMLSLPDEPLPDHATDALAVGVCHANHAPLAAVLAGPGR